MSYQKQAWRDYDDTKTELQNLQNGAVVTPERMNHIETGIANSADKQEVAAQLAQKVGDGVKARPEDLSADVLGLITGEGGSINLQSIPQNKSVTPEKLDDLVRAAIGKEVDLKLEYGKNRYNKTTSLQNHILNWQGGVVASNGFITSDFIEVPSNTNITVKHLRYLVEYNDFKKPVGVWKDNASGGQLTIQTRVDTKFVRVTHFSNLDGTQQVELGEVASPYLTYSKPKLVKSDDSEIKTDSFTIKPKKNLFNKNTVLKNYTLSEENGNHFPSVGWFVSDFIEVDNTKMMTINRPRYIMEYDINQKFLDISYGQSGSPKVTMQPTKQTKYIRVSGSMDFVDSLQVEYGNTVTGYEPFSLAIYDDNTRILNAEPVYTIKPKKNLFNKENVLTDYTLDESTGNTVASPSWFVSEFIEVDNTKEIMINRARYIMEYDSNQKYLGLFYGVAGSPAVRMTPSDKTRYIRLSASLDFIDELQMEYGNKVSSYEPFALAVYKEDTKVFDLDSNAKKEVEREELLKLTSYDKIIDRDNYEIWKYDWEGTQVQAVYRDIAIRSNHMRLGALIEISTTGINGEYEHSVYFNNENFPGLIDNSDIEHILVVPWSRNASTFWSAGQWRMVLITTKGQIYHNFPSRNTINDGQEQVGDIIRFDESAVWDLPEEKYPSNNTSATGTERYFPGLPAERYLYYPAVNKDNGYSNGGFGKSITKGGVTYPRFYQPGRESASNSFGFMGGFEPDDKIQIIGTYKSNAREESVRICIFASDDGGRTWYNKYEFTRHTPSTHTAINSTDILENYVANSLSVSQRKLISPSAENKEPDTMFIWEDPIVVTNIEKGAKTIIELENNSIKSEAIIAFKTNSGSSWSWLVNDLVSATSGGNGLLFGLRQIGDTSRYELYEYPNTAFNNIQCRHIHHVNRVKDGWLFGSGENYPNGFVFFMQMKESDNFRNKLAHEDFDIVRLTSTEKSVQRLLGADMKDDADSTMIVAIDDEIIPRDPVKMPSERTDNFSRSSVGIFKGKLADIDDMSKFECIYEAKEVAYFFKKKGDAYIFSGQRGEFAISFDEGKSWFTEDLGNAIVHFRGESKKYVVIDGFIIIVKH